ncbi:uncharacterized protein LOC100750125 [Bombus impatiens]|uniref:Uncharacterized protein LOC100750125 n=1 Tax=Bombus impatiens TaxID=132113 RepID=A0A6P3UWJ1_BOMIM|nr:uncharacterized protein LOC100750125 [Bombus impatiens]
MDIKRSQCSKTRKMLNTPGSKTKQEPTEVSVKSVETNYVTQIVSSGIRPDNVYETKILLGPEVDLSSIKITVKGNNLRINMIKALEEQLTKQLPDISERSVFGNLIKRMMKHCENLLIPEGIDNAKVRAVVDNVNGMLILTAPPAIKQSK